MFAPTDGSHHLSTAFYVYSTNFWRLNTFDFRKVVLLHQRMKTKMSLWITLLSCNCCQDSRRVPTTSCPLDKHPLRKRRVVVYQQNLIGTTTAAFNNVTSWIYHTPPPLMHITTPPNCDVHIRAKCAFTIYLDMMELYNLPKKALSLI